MQKIFRFGGVPWALKFDLNHHNVVHYKKFFKFHGFNIQTLNVNRLPVIVPEYVVSSYYAFPTSFIYSFWPFL